MAPATAASAPRGKVWASEVAFARAMADRDLHRFSELVADEAVFFSAIGVSRGRSKVVDAWAGYFEDAVPLFAWEPDQVEVLASGRLALSTGPMRSLWQSRRALQLRLAPRAVAMRRLFDASHAARVRARRLRLLPQPAA